MSDGVDARDASENCERGVAVVDPGDTRKLNLEAAKPGNLIVAKDTPAGVIQRQKAEGDDRRRMQPLSDARDRRPIEKSSQQKNTSVTSFKHKCGLDGMTAVFICGAGVLLVEDGDEIVSGCRSMCSDNHSTPPVC